MQSTVLVSLNGEV